MASRAEIIETIRQGAAQVRHTFGALSDEQLQTRVHEGERGWTAKEVLAHLAARGPVNDYLLQPTASERTSLTGGASMDDWNQARIDEQMTKSRDALLAEFETVQEALIERVQALSDDLLARPIPLPQGEMPLGDLLGMAGGAHAGHHAQEVEQAIAGSAKE